MYKQRVRLCGERNWTKTTLFYCDGVVLHIVYRFVFCDVAALVPCEQVLVDAEEEYTGEVTHTCYNI